ncbi:MAG: lysostaphin resistance A-like protein [Lachnospiraceae bacterium]
MKKESVMMTLWKIFYPMLIHLGVQNIVVIIATVWYTSSVQMSYLADGIETDMETITAEVYALYEQNALLLLMIATVICIPIFCLIYKHTKKETKKVSRNIPMQSRDVLAVIISSAALSLALNNVILLSPLPVWFPSYYENTANLLFADSIVLQVVQIGILACVAEELLMRGIAYRHLKYRWGRRTAIFVSALIFGIYHFNVVQAVYAFFLGLFFAWLVERYDTLWASIIAHMSANLFSVLISANTIFEFMYEGMIGFCLSTCGAILIFYFVYRWMKATDPLIELEFVEREPDTLKKLSEEYHESKKNQED